MEEQGANSGREFSPPFAAVRSALSTVKITIKMCAQKILAPCLSAGRRGKKLKIAVLTFAVEGNKRGREMLAC